MKKQVYSGMKHIELYESHVLEGIFRYSRDINAFVPMQDIEFVCKYLKALKKAGGTFTPAWDTTPGSRSGKMLGGLRYHAESKNWLNIGIASKTGSAAYFNPALSWLIADLSTPEDAYLAVVSHEFVHYIQFSNILTTEDEAYIDREARKMAKLVVKTKKGVQNGEVNSSDYLKMSAEIEAHLAELYQCYISLISNEETKSETINALRTGNTDAIFLSINKELIICTEYLKYFGSKKAQPSPELMDMIRPELKEGLLKLWGQGGMLSLIEPTKAERIRKSFLTTLSLLSSRGTGEVNYDRFEINIERPDQQKIIFFAGDNIKSMFDVRQYGWFPFPDEWDPKKNPKIAELEKFVAAQDQNTLVYAAFLDDDEDCLDFCKMVEEYSSQIKIQLARTNRRITKVVTFN